MTAVTVIPDEKLSNHDKRDDFRGNIELTKGGNWEFWQSGS
jgi:hypothetical protein